MTTAPPQPLVLAPEVLAPDRTVLLVGQPNVGKSALFGALTGRHAFVSNYPGTTVSLSSGTWQVGGREDPGFRLIDTPGAYSLLPVTDDERVTRNALFQAPVAAVLHVVEARSLDRGLATTIELITSGLPVVLVLNMQDEADRAGVVIDRDELERRLGCPVVSTVATERSGLDALAAAVQRVIAAGPTCTGDQVGALWVEEFGPIVDRLAASIPLAAGAGGLPPAMPPRIAVALALRGSREIDALSGLSAAGLDAARREVAQRVAGMPPVVAILALRRRAGELLAGIFHRPLSPSATWQHRAGILLGHPLWGLPFLAAVLYFGFYQLVGVVVAGELVGWLEEDVFGSLMRSVKAGIEGLLPWEWLSSLFVGDYGVLTLGVTYALALVLPVVGAFFVLFSIVEDSGYFPRLAMLCDRLFKFVGLNGRAVITMVLGLGCSTMATVTTRTLETGRDRILATLLLVLTIPCSAQLGLIMALLGSRGFSLWIVYVGCLLFVFLVVGWIAARVLPGRNATFHMELVPMRWPRPGNVLRKTWQRLYWYFREVVPLFVYASVILWALDLDSAVLFGHSDASGTVAADALFWIKEAMEPVIALFGQPREAAESFLVGFVRRDFGAAGLYQLSEAGDLAGDQAKALSNRQLLVGSFTLTLFVPCIATFMMMCKERGSRIAMTIFALVTVTALGSGALLNQILLALGWK